MENSMVGNNKSRFYDILTYIFICLPPLLFFIMVNKFAVNLPFRDDHPAILQFLNNFKTSSGVDRFMLMVAQHNEHRIFFSRVVYVVYYYIFGGINFRNLIFIGDIQLIFVLLITIHFIRKALPDNWRMASVLMSLFIFDISGSMNMTWAMAGIQNWGVVFFFFVSLYFYSFDKKPYLFLGALFQALGTFSSGNGTIASFALVLYALLSRDRQKIIFAVTTFFVFTSLYFIHYVPTISQARSTVKMLFINYLYLLGGHVYIGMRRYNGYMMQLLGLCTGICLVYLLPVGRKLKVELKNLPIVAILLFVLGTMTSMVYIRFAGLGEVTPSRYLVYCNFIPGIIFVFYLIKFKSHKYQKPLIITFTVLSLICFERNFRLGYGELMTWRHDVIHNVPDPFTPWDPVVEQATRVQSCQLGIYCIDRESARKENQ